ncbi:MAG TPA: hypothetical protein VGG79_12975 [Roseiarcus sp.]|jgi:hypothetical protein
MQSPIYSLAVFVAMCASASLGFFIHSRLSEKHRSADSIALVQLTITLLVTFTAIVLGLLTTSVKAGFDTAYTARGEDAAQLAQLDRCLRDYGPETAPMRKLLRGYAATVIASTWPDEPRPAGVDIPDVSKMPLTGESQTLSDVLSEIGRGVRELKPTDAFHTNQMAACGAEYSDLLNARWKVIEGARPSISPPFYWVLVIWLSILFGAFGLTARPNVMVATIIVLSALSITSAVFVILDMDEPYGGLFGVPSASMRNALDDMMRPGG